MLTLSKIRRALRTGQYDLLCDPWRCYFSPLMGVVAGGRTVAVSTEYFGVTNASAYTSSDYWNGYTMRTRDEVVAYTCPGSGTRRVQSIEHWCKLATGTGNIRLAIYTTSGSLVGQGSGVVSLSSTSLGFVGHIGTSNLTPSGGSAGDAVNLTGGTRYVLCVCASSINVRYGYKTTTNSVAYLNTDYISGFPSTLNYGSGWTNLGQEQAFKIGVQ